MIVAVDGKSGKWRVVEIHWDQGLNQWRVTVQEMGLSFLSEYSCPITSIRPYPSKMRFELTTATEMGPQMRQAIKEAVQEEMESNPLVGELGLLRQALDEYWPNWASEIMQDYADEKGDFSGQACVPIRAAIKLIERASE